MTIETVAPVTPDASGVKIETRRTETRQEVLESFNRVYSAFKSAPREQLDEIEDKWIATGRDDLEANLTNGRINFSEGKDSYMLRLKDHNGKAYTRTFYLQIEGMMGYAAAQARNSILSEEQRSQFERDVIILEKYSYSVIAKDRGPRELRAIRKARNTQYELDRIQNNPDLSSGDAEKDFKRAARRIQTDIRYFVPPKDNTQTTEQIEVTEQTILPPWATSSEPGEIRTDTAGNRTHPWETATLEGIASQRQDEAPWGRPNLPKDVEVRTDHELGKKIKNDAEKISSLKKGAEEKPATDNISAALIDFDAKFFAFKDSEGTEANQKAKQELGDAIRSLAELTGDKEAVTEYLQSRFTRSIMLSQKEHEFSEESHQQAREREQKALDRIYESADAKIASQGDALEGESPTPSPAIPDALPLPTPPADEDLMSREEWEKEFAKANRGPIPNPQRTVEAPAPVLSEKEQQAIGEIDYITQQYETDLNFAELNKTKGDPKVAEIEANAVKELGEKIIFAIGGNQEAFDRYDAVARRRQKFYQVIEEKYGISHTNLTFDEKTEEHTISEELSSSLDELRRLAIEKANSTPAEPLTPAPDSGETLAPAIPTEEPPVRIEPFPFDAPRPVVDEFGPGELGFDPFFEPTETGPAPVPITPAEIRKYQIILARDESELTERNRKNAEDFLREEMKRGSVFNPLNWKRKVGYRLVEHGMRHHFIERVREARLKTGIAYADVDLARNAATRITSGHIETTVREQAAKLESIRLGEGRVHSVEDVHLKTLIFNEIIEPTIISLEREGASVATFAQMQKRLGEFTARHQGEKAIKDIFGADGSPYGENAYYFATNLMDIAEQISRDHTAHTFSLDMLDISLASAKPTAQGEVKLSVADKLIRFGQRRTGGALNPAIVGGAFSLALNPAIIGVNAVTRIPGVGILSGALSGSFLAAARRNYDLKMDMAAHRVDIKYGEKTPEGAKRREALEQFAYKTESVANLLYVDRDITEGAKIPRAMAGDGRSMATLLDSGRTDLSIPENKYALIRRMAEIRTRLDASTALGISLITFDSNSSTQTGRLELIRALSEAQIRLSAGYEPSESDVETYQRTLGEWAREFTTDKIKQDRDFKKYRLKQSLRAGARGAVQGAAAGLIVGETVKLANRVAQELNIDFGAIISTPARAAAPRIAPKTNIISGRSTQELVFQAERPNIKTGDKLASVMPIDSTPQAEASIKAAKKLTSASISDQSANIHRAIETAIPVESNLDGKPLTIPQHTRWKIDPVNGGTDLISSRDGRVLLNNVHWENGELRAEPGLWNPTDQITTETTSNPDLRKVMGKNGLWEDLSVDPRKVRWDNNGTPGISDGDELRLFDKRDGNGVVFKIPKSADGVFLNVNGERVWVPKSGDSHLVRLDPDSRIKIPGRTDGMTYGDVARMTIDQDELRKYHGSLQTEVYTDRRKIFRVDAIEAADFKNGKATIVASIKGEGHLPKEFKVGTQTNTTFKIIPGEIPAEPSPSPTPTPTPTPEPTPTPTPEPTPSPTPIPTPVPTPTPTPDVTPSPTAPPTPEITPLPTETPSPLPTPETTPLATPEPTLEPSPSPSPSGGGGFINNIPDMTNLGLDIPAVLPFAPRYGLEKMESSTRMTPTTPLPPSGFTPPPPFPSRPTPLAPTPRPSGRGAEYRARANIARAEAEAERRELESLRSETSGTQNLKEIPNSTYFEQIGSGIQVDINNPKTPDRFYGPILNKVEWFGNGQPTLAGKVMHEIYTTNLISRPVQITETRDLASLSNQSRENVQALLDQINKMRSAKKQKEITLTTGIDYDTDGFHFNNKGPQEEFNLHFSTSAYSHRDPNSPQLRAYVTIPLSEIGNIEKYFIDISTQLYDANINFSAKADNPIGASRRTENMVFYINPTDQVKASQIIGAFLSTRGIGEGRVLAAIPGHQDGLSWAVSPTSLEVKLYEEITGSRKSVASFNAFAAAMMTPIYMERLASAHEAKGNTEAAEIFRREAERVRLLIQAYQASITPPKTPILNQVSSVISPLTNLRIDRLRTTSRVIASGTNRGIAQTINASARLGRGTASISTQTARLASRKAGDIIERTGEAAGKIPDEAIGAISPLSGIGYGGGVVPSSFIDEDNEVGEAPPSNIRIYDSVNNSLGNRVRRLLRRS